MAEDGVIEGVSPIRGEVDELITLHQDSIDELRAHGLERGWLVEPYTDDIWLLRYVLSFKKAKYRGSEWLKPTADYMQNMIEFRSKHKEAFAPIQAGGNPADDVEVQQCLVHYLAFTRDGGPVNIIDIALCNLNKISDKLGHDRLVQYHIEAREKDFVICDRLTRKTRKLVKMVSVIDLYQASVSNPTTNPTKPTNPANPTRPFSPTNPTNPTNPSNPPNPTHPTGSFTNLANPDRPSYSRAPRGSAHSAPRLRSVTTRTRSFCARPP
jgi:hypothetical protein